MIKTPIDYWALAEQAHAKAAAWEREATYLIAELKKGKP